MAQLEGGGRLHETLVDGELPSASILEEDPKGLVAALPCLLWLLRESRDDSGEAVELLAAVSRADIRHEARSTEELIEAASEEANMDPMATGMSPESWAVGFEEGSPAHQVRAAWFLLDQDEAAASKLINRIGISGSRRLTAVVAVILQCRDDPRGNPRSASRLLAMAPVGALLVGLLIQGHPLAAEDIIEGVIDAVERQPRAVEPFWECCRALQQLSFHHGAIILRALTRRKLLPCICIQLLLLLKPDSDARNDHFGSISVGAGPGADLIEWVATRLHSGECCPGTPSRVCRASG